MAQHYEENSVKCVDLVLIAAFLIGLRIKNLRNKKGLSQEIVAEKADITSKHLSSIERGKENPTLDTFLKLAAALDLEVWELLDISNELTRKEMERKMAKLLKSIKDQEMRMTLKFVDSITK